MATTSPEKFISTRIPFSAQDIESFGLLTNHAISFNKYSVLSILQLQVFQGQESSHTSKI
jgi:hypothetical protein